MSNKNIKSVLDEALEQEIPASEIKLWPAVRSALGTGNRSLIREGEKMNRNNPSRLRWRVAYVTLAGVCFLAIAFMTPQGRAFAQEVLQFFTRLEVDNYYEEPSDLTFEETTAFHEDCGIAIAPKCSIEEIRSKVGFEVKVFTILPDGMFYQGATGGPDLVGLSYIYRDGDRLGGSLGLVVEPADSPDPIVAKSANVEQVFIGDLPAEFFKGILFQDDQGNVTWLPDDPTMTLRWDDGGSTYTLYYYSTRYPLTKEYLIMLAENMTLDPVEN